MYMICNLIILVKYIKRTIFFNQIFFFSKVRPPSFSTLNSKNFLLLPFFSRPFLKIDYLTLNWVYLTLKWNLGLPHFDSEIEQLAHSSNGTLYNWKLPQIPRYYRDYRVYRDYRDYRVLPRLPRPKKCTELAPLY